MELVESLKDIGLEEREVKIYLALLELGESTVLPVAQKSDIKRTYAYDVLDSLMKKGLVSYVEKNGRRRYAAEDPKKIDQILRDRLAHFRDVLPEIMTIFNRSINKPKVRFYEGSDNIRGLYEEFAHVKEYVSLASPDHFYDLLGKPYLDYLTTNILKNKTKVRELFAQSYTEVHFQKRYVKGLQEMRLLPPEIELDTDLTIFDRQKLVLISYAGVPHAISIEGSTIIDTHLKMFDLLWAATSPIK